MNLKFWAIVTHSLQKRWISIDIAHSTSAITPSKKVHLSLIRCPLWAFQWANSCLITFFRDYILIMYRVVEGQLVSHIWIVYWWIYSVNVWWGDCYPSVLSVVDVQHDILSFIQRALNESHLLDIVVGLLCVKCNIFIKFCTVTFSSVKCEFTCTYRSLARCWQTLCKHFVQLQRWFQLQVWYGCLNLRRTFDCLWCICYALTDHKEPLVLASSTYKLNSFVYILVIYSLKKINLKYSKTSLSRHIPSRS